MQPHKLGVARDINSEVPRGRRQPLLLLLWQLLRLVLYHYLLLPREGRSHIIMVSVLVLDQEVDHQLVLVEVEVLERDGKNNNGLGEYCHPHPPLHHHYHQSHHPHDKWQSKLSMGSVVVVEAVEATTIVATTLRLVRAIMQQRQLLLLLLLLLLVLDGNQQPLPPTVATKKMKNEEYDKMKLPPDVENIKQCLMPINPWRYSYPNSFVHGLKSCY